MADKKQEFFNEIKEEFKELGSKVNKMFDEFVKGGEGGEYSFSVDIYENNENFIFEADLPGLKKEEVKLQIRDNNLTIHGERIRQSGLGDVAYHRRERNFGSFRRSFSIPAGVDMENVKAKFDLGTLSVTFPKLGTGTAPEKEIKIN